MSDTVCFFHGIYYCNNITQQRLTLRMQNRRQSITKSYENQEIQNFIKEKLDVLMIELILPTVNISGDYRCKVGKKSVFFLISSLVKIISLLTGNFFYV